MIKILKIIFLFIFLTTNAVAGSDGDLKLSNKSKPTKDCFEQLNRATFALNQGLDKAILKPVAKGYRSLPAPIKKGTGNVLNNLSTLITIPNNVLQGDIKLAAINTGRLVVNTTLGILGIFDPASEMGFPTYVKEDYGQTLGAWGVGPGCYLVLPVLGPSTARDTIASTANFLGGDAWYNVTVRNDTHYFRDVDYYSSKITSGVDFRAKNYDSIENLKENSLDFYASVKSLYLQDRQQKIANTKAIIKTLNDNDWEEIENN